MVTLTVSLADEIFDALGDGTRRDILGLLRSGPQAVGEIASQLPVSRPAVSKHLRILAEAGLVTHEAHGTRHVFELDRSGFAAAREYLDTFWTVALGNFERLVAAKKAKKSG